MHHRLPDSVLTDQTPHWRTTPTCHNLFVFSGVPGAGKTTCLCLCESLGVVVFQKDTTRRPRSAEVVARCCDARFITPAELAERARTPRYATYRLCEDDFGVDLAALRAACRAHQNMACTITDPALIRRLPTELLGVRVVTILVHAEQAQIAERLQGTGPAVEVDERLSRTPAIAKSFRDDPFLFAHILMNVFGLDVLERHLRALLARYQPIIQRTQKEITIRCTNTDEPRLHS